MKRLKPLADLLRGQRWLILVTALLSVAQSLLLLPVALLVKRVFDTSIPHRDNGAIASAAALMLLLYSASALAGLANRYLVIRTVKRVVSDLRSRLWRRLYLLSAAQSDSAESTALHANIVQDSERLDQSTTAAMATLLPSAMVTVGLSVVALYVDPVLTGVLAAVVPLLFGITKVLSRAVRRCIDRWQQAFDAFSADVTDGLRRLDLTRVLGTSAQELTHNDALIDELREAGTAMSWRIGAFNIFQGFIATGAGLAVLVVGSREVIDGRLSLGSLLSFYALSALLLRSVASLLNTLPSLAVGGPCLDRINTFLDQPYDSPYAGAGVLDFQGELELRDVHFAYHASDVDLLRGVDLHIRSGQRVVIVGPNGAGKSTLVRLMLGLYRPRTGTLLADGVPFDDLDPEALHARIGVVMQEQVLHRGTIAEVIAAGRPVSPAEVRLAAEAAGATGFVDLLPHGFDTVAGEAAKLLSGGQRQRLALARALLMQPALLLLDEPTTYLDDVGVAGLLATLAALPQRPTVVMVTHDHALAGQADQVVYVRDGQVALTTAEAL